MKKSFLNAERTILTTMIKSTTLPEALVEIRKAAEIGTDAFGIQLEAMGKECRSREGLTELFGAAGEKPVYVTDYRKGNALLHTDEELAEELLFITECGATLLDVQGDLFDPQPGEYTTDEKAVEKQKKLIAEIHRLGGEVLMSSHVYKEEGGMYFVPLPQLRAMAQGQEARGADICKIVTNADTEQELDENFEITLMLKRELKSRFLFLCNGKMCYRHRRIGPVLGSCMFLNALNPAEGVTQPSLKEAKAVLAALGYRDLP